MPTLMTIERHILEQQRIFQGATGVFSGLLSDMALAAKIIAREATRAGLADILGATDHKNVHGEIQQKLDIFADETIQRICGTTGRLCAMVSEEHEKLLPISKTHGYGKYVLVYDPLDGSSNISANVSTGTIFAIYRKISSGKQGQLKDVLQPGRQIAAAGYVIYGPSTMFIYSTGQGVFGFTLEPGLGEFLLTHEQITLPEIPLYYSANQGNERFWSAGVQRYVKWLQGMGEAIPYRLHARYTGSLVMDFHRNLLGGGVYFYPGSSEKKDGLHGKLRLVYEAAPLAFIAEQAGGYASDGSQRILDIVPTTLHQTTPLYIGEKLLVQRAETYVESKN